jgi:predicted AAA+ superfamily ATPase
MLQRKKFLNLIQEQMQVHPVCALLGPRQCGKTTLALQSADETVSTPHHHFDLENPEDLAALENPLRVLEQLSGLIIIDEIQRLPNLFPILRVLVDRNREKARYLILGSASRDLIQQSSETLAGRIGYIELTPFQLNEDTDMNTLLTRGGFPLSYLAHSDHASLLWRESYIQTFLERDIPNLGFKIPPMRLRRFWLMLTHVHGQLLNMSDLSNSLDISNTMVKHYIDVLAGTFMIRVLQPWFVNIQKRQIKTPKIFFRDTGLLLSLLSIRSYAELLRNPKLGAIWEGFALEQIINTLGLRSDDIFFWRTSNGAELDLLILHQGEYIGFEFKFSDAPRTTKSMHNSIADLNLKHLYVIYPGEREIFLSDRITAIGLAQWVQHSKT